jgi:mannose-1-phosphate guanylyltransferase/mannose-6-phosphate isomerase
MFPKQFIRFFKNQPNSFLAATLQRLGHEQGFASPLVICNNDHRFLVRDEADRLKIKPQAIVLEPVARNTAPAIAAAAVLVERADPDGVLVVMPSDHVIENEAAFATAVLQAGEIAATGKLVLFGIPPASPHTGYGYIHRGAPLDDFEDAYTVAAFAEKPDSATAERYLATGLFLWNSGIFVLGARGFLN